MSSKPDLTRNDYEHLSAYIDGMLTEDERANLEKRLEDESALAEEFAILRQTVALVRQLPQLKAPRNFTLTPAMVTKRSKLSLVPRPPHGKHRPIIIPFPLMRAASAAISLMIIAFGVIVLFSASESGQDSAAIALSVSQAEVSLHSNTAPADAIATRPPSPEMPMAAPPAVAADSADAAPPPEVMLPETTSMTQPDVSPIPELAYDVRDAQQDEIEAEEALQEMQMLDDAGNGRGMGGGDDADAPGAGYYDVTAPMAAVVESQPEPMEEQSIDDGDASAMRTTGEAAPDSETIPTPISQEPQQDEVKTVPTPTHTAPISTQTAIEVTSVAAGSESDKDTTSDNTQAEFAQSGEPAPSSKVGTADNATLLGVVLILTGSILFVLIVALPWIQRRRI